MADESDAAVAILTMADIRRWFRDKAALEKDIKTRQEQLAVIDRKIEAATVLAPDAVKGAIGSYVVTESMLAMDDSGGFREAVSRNRLTDDLIELVNRSERFLAPADIRAALEEGGYREQLRKNPNYLYTVINRAVKTNRIGRYGAAYGPVAKRVPSEGEPGSGQPRLDSNPLESMEAAETARNEVVHENID